MMPSSVPAAVEASVGTAFRRGTDGRPAGLAQPSGAGERRNRLLVAGGLGIGVAVAVFMTFHYGRRGYMPLDQSVVWDGAWRTLHGQVPFRDYIAPSAVTPSLIQALVFKVAGVSWFTYLLHSAVFNGLFVLMAYWLLRMMDTDRFVAVFYAGLSGVVFYVPIGTPQDYQHSFFFALLAVAMGVAARRTTRDRSKFLLWFGIPSVLALGFLSKQTAIIVMAPVVLLFAVFENPRQRRLVLGALSLGVLAAGTVAAVLAASLHIPPGRLIHELIELPIRSARSRTSRVFSPRLLFGICSCDRGPAVNGSWGITLPYLIYPAGLGLLALSGRHPGFLRQEHLNRRLRQSKAAFVVGALVLLVLVLAQAPLPDVSILPLTVGVVGCAVVAGAVVRSLRDPGWVVPLRSTQRAAVLLALGLLLVCAYVAAATNNEPQNSLPYLFISAGLLTTVAWRHWQTSGDARHPLSVIALGLVIVLTVLSLDDAGHLDQTVNRVRYVHGGLNRPIDGVAKGLPGPLSFMQLDDSQVLANGIAVLNAVKRLPANFFVFGDSSVLYAVAGKPSTGISLYFHPGLGLPLAGTPEHAAYEARLLQRLRSYHVGYVVVEGDKTWMGVRLADFPRLAALVDKPCGESTYGTIRVVMLCPGAL